jgi:hypothetical protein
VAIEIETGRRALGGVLHPEPRASREPVPPPSLADVLGSLLLDASAIDHPTFESWAGDYGYSEDSRSAEAVYRACLAHALALRSALGDDVLSAMRELAAEL